MRKTTLAAGFVFAAIAPVSAQAQVSDNMIRIGVLTDLSGIYSDINGEGSVTQVTGEAWTTARAR